MIEVMKEFKLRCAHKLCNLPQGHKCMKMHGEYYTIRLYLRVKGKPTQTLPQHGMLLDFGDIKDIFNEVIFSRYDHATLIKSDDHLLPFLQQENQKLVILDYPPTAECMSELIYNDLKSRIPSLHKVEVVESEGCHAAYIADDEKEWSV